MTKYIIKRLLLAVLTVFIICAITFFLNTPLLLGYSVIGFLIFLVLLYLAIGALMGRYSYFPWVSDIIKGNIRG